MPPFGPPWHGQPVAVCAPARRGADSQLGLVDLVASRSDQLHGQIRQTVRDLAANIRVHAHAVAHQMGLGSTDCRFLALLTLYGPLTPGQLATSTGLTSGAVTGVIDRLERAGLVCRQHHTADRRSRYIVPLPAGRARITAEYGHWIDLLDTTLHRHNATELAAIADFLADLTSDMGSPEQLPRSTATAGPQRTSHTTRTIGGSRGHET
jgi:DNA-binding MarR family transcriptional regulator